VVEATWSHCADESRADESRAGQDCVRLVGVPSGAVPEMRPATAFRSAPAMAGRLVPDGDAVCFVPRFGFVAGTAYTVTVADAVVATLTRPRVEQSAMTGVAAIQPAVDVLPRNLLRCYVTFTAPMSEGEAARHVRLVDDEGEPLADALLPMEYELWDADRRRLTVLLDPARIKRGLVAHDYPLRTGGSFRLVVAAGFRDARGVPLVSGTQRRYRVGDDLRGRVDPGSWRVTVSGPLVVAFGRPLDHALVDRCLRVVGPDGKPVHGSTGTDGGSWSLLPDRPWLPGTHRLVVDPVLEDVAGNSVTRVFDRDLDDTADQPGPTGPVEVAFTPVR
jgi:hypothetical protein